MYEVIVSDDITILQGCGLGGTSLINASVGLDADPRVFEDKRWPQAIRDDMTHLLDVDRKHVHEMLQPNVYPDFYPKPKKLEAMEKAAKGLGIPDVEDIGEIFKKTPLYVFICLIYIKCSREISILDSMVSCVLKQKIMCQDVNCLEPQRDSIHMEI